MTSDEPGLETLAPGPEDDHDGSGDLGLWAGDEGELPPEVRQVLVALLRNSHLSLKRQGKHWATLLTYESAIRSRLHDLFLEIIIDREHEIAFVRQVDYEDAPQVVRTQSLTFMDTLALLLIRQTLLAEEGRGRPFIGFDEMVDQLSVYRDGRDETDFRSRVHSSWQKLVKWGLLSRPENDRAEISPIVRFLVDSERVAAIQGAYDRLAAQADPPMLDGFEQVEEGSDVE